MHSEGSTQLSLPLCDRQLPVVYRSRPQRRRTLLSGKLVYSEGPFAPDGEFTLDCSVRNISEGGAKIVVPVRQLLPPNLYLIVIKYCVAYWARVVWLDLPARGLQFSKTYSLSATLPHDMKFLRRLWGDLYTKPGVLDW
jgi:hypothetical protein